MDIGIMKIKNNELRTKTASEGKVLTNGVDFSSVGGFICLAYNDKPENWYEITDKEAKRLKNAELPE